MNRKQRRQLMRRQDKETTALRAASSRRGSAAALKASHRLFELGRVAEALPMLRQALAQEPDDVPLRAAFAYALAATGSVDTAIAEYRDLLQREPNSAPVATNLAALLKAKDADAALQLLLRASELAPGHANTAYMLGELYTDMGKSEEAFRQLRRAIALFRKQIGPNAGPERIEDLVKLATAQMLTGDMENALTNFDRAVSLRPNHILALARRGLALARMRRIPEAVSTLKRAAAIDPGFAEVRRALGDILLTAGKVEAAQAQYRKTLQINPEDALAKYFLGAAEKAQSPDAPPPGYVVRLFNDYAQNFEKHLVDTLKYRAPEILCETLQRIAQPPDRSWTIVDLGCGTGLCGPLLRPYAARLIGVDLSHGMLEKAAAKNAYDVLIQSDIAVSLDRIDEPVDAFISADVFVYIGNLSRVFTGVARLLRPGGWFAFTTEILDGDGFRVETSGRYLHSGAYIAALANDLGFDVAHVEAITARYQSSCPVMENLHVLKRRER